MQTVYLGYCLLDAGRLRHLLRQDGADESLPIHTIQLYIRSVERLS